MNHNNNFTFLSSTSSFVSYSDLTNTSTGNYNNVLQIINRSFPILNQPNIDTHHAIEEARDHENLKIYNDIDDFFSDLEK